MKKFLSVLLAVCLLAACLPLSASAAWSSNYTLTGNQAQDIINVAVAQAGKTGGDLGYSVDWCSYFINDCAQKAGINHILRQGVASSLYREMTRYGVEGHYFTDVIAKLPNWTGGASGGMTRGYDTQFSTGINSSSWTPKLGDIVFFTHKTNTGKTIQHVGMVQSASGASFKVVHGNWSSKVVKDYSMTRGQFNGSYIVCAYVRPDYKPAPTPTPTPKPSDNPNDYIKSRNKNDAGFYTASSNIIEFTTLPRNIGTVTHSPSPSSVKYVHVTESVINDAGNKWYYADYYYDKSGTKVNQAGYIYRKEIEYYSKTLPEPTNTSVKTDKSVYTLGETVTITTSGDNVSGFRISVRDATNTDNIIYYPDKFFTAPMTFRPDKAGEYIVFTSPYDLEKKYHSGPRCTFKVVNTSPEPTNVSVKTDKSVYTLGETVTITASGDNVSGFRISVREAANTDNIVYFPDQFFTAPMTFRPDKAGEYIVFTSPYDLDRKYHSGPRCTFSVIEDSDLSSDPPLDPTPENSFIDVPNGAYFAEAVNWAVDKGITAGTSSNTFSPNAICTRAQAVTFLWRAAGSPEPSGSSSKFVDVAGGQYYTKAVQWAVEKGITGGTSATTFSPNDKCTRAQIVTFQYRMHNSPAVSGVSPFADVPPSLYYANAVAWAVENGITSGTSASTFSPHNDCSRGQIVTFLYRDANK